MFMVYARPVAAVVLCSFLFAGTALSQTIGGRVTDQDSGLPIQGIDVEVYELGFFTQLVATETTDSNGDYQTPALGSGTFLAIANPGGSLNYAPELYSEQPCAAPCIITVGTAIPLGISLDNIDFTLEISGSLTGITTDVDSGTPLDQRTIEVFTLDGTLVGRQVTDGTGIHDFGPMSPGEYVLVNRGNGDSPYGSVVYDGRVCPLEGCDVTQGDTVMVESGMVTANIDFPLSTLGVIEGQVTLPMGAAVSPVNIVAASVDGTQLRSTLIDAPGAFSLEGLPDGEYYLFADPFDDFLISETLGGTSCAFGCALGAADRIMIQSLGTVSGADFDLTLGGSIDLDLFEEGTGNNLPFPRANLYSSAGQFLASFSGTIFGPNVTLRGLPVDDYYIATNMTQANYMDEAFPDQPCLGEACDVTLGDLLSVTAGVANEIQMSLASGQSVSGTVSLLQPDMSLRPLGDLPISIWDTSLGRLYQRQTNTLDGAFSFGGLPAVGDYRLVVGDAGEAGTVVYDGVPCPFLGCDVNTGTPVSAPSAAIEVIITEPFVLFGDGFE